MAEIDYNGTLQDYIEDLNQLHNEFTKMMSKVTENSKDIQKLRGRLDLRENSLKKYYNEHGFSDGPNPQEAQILGKFEKETKSALNKCEDNKARLRSFKAQLEAKLNKMNAEALNWDPQARAILEEGGDPNFLDYNGYKTAVGEKRKISLSGFSQNNFGSRRSNNTPSRSRKPPRGSNQREKHQSRVEDNGLGINEEFYESVDENDDRIYCFCNRESFGEMVGCDGKNCPHEWFHYECVGLTEPPTGTWYCPSCSAELNVV